jgi:endonuclease VIII-like 1
MPELAEIKIMSEYINTVCKHKDFTSIAVSPEVERRLSVAQPSDLQVFSITAEARGKELLLTLSSGKDHHRLKVSMGMSGHWVMTNRDWMPKHTHLKFNTVDGMSLCLVDARRFAKWGWTTGWSPNRGPCPVSEHSAFVENISQNLKKAAFSKPIHLVLMDQRYFNGIGNYLRAEILYRAEQDPFQEARAAILANLKILDLCKTLSGEAYLIGGGQLKDWTNPFEVPADGFTEWIQCYGKSDTAIVDANGRTLWYYQSQCKNQTNNDEYLK